jgi:hypothetical protein
MFHTNHADLEGMFTTIGVIAALLLSIQVGAFMSITYEELEVADYRGSIYYNDFRRFIYKELNRIDPEYEFMIDFGGPEPFNLTSVLLFEDTYDTWDQISYTQRTKNYDRVFHATRLVFPLWKTVPWLEEFDLYVTSRIFLNFNAASASIFTLVLFISMFFYTTLALSNSREEDEKVGGEASLPTARFAQIGMPVIVGAYISLIMGSVYFFYAYCLVQTSKSPTMATLSDYNRHMYFALAPLTFVMCMLSILALWRTNHSFTKAGKADLAEWREANRRIKEERRKGFNDELGIG